MLPCISIAGHLNYVQHITIHVHLKISQLAEKGIKADFLKGRHVGLGQRNDGMLHAVFQDQFREKTIIRYGKGRSGPK